MSRDFGRNLRYQRSLRKMTQEEFAAYVGVSLSAYRMYERGKREPTFELLCQISDVLSMRVDELVRRTSTQEEELDEAHLELIRLYDHAYPEVIKRVVIEILQMHQGSPEEVELHANL